ncbi:MAG: hypothetical protein QOJ29_3785 [Thermoleophilaceae bacterium]|nr:hypothetical protein [Thermoleophilaceae bacterium]
MAHSLHIDPNSWGPGGSSGVDHLIAAVAWRQFGVIARSHLVELGLATKEIDYRVAVGRLHVIRRGVYAVGHERLVPEGRFLAAVFAGGADAVLSHRSAARHWGLVRYDGRIEVTTPRNRRQGKDVRYSRASVESLDRTEHRGIPITTVGRTLLDLGAVAPKRVPKAFEQADQLDLLDVTDLERLIQKHERRPGTAALRRLVVSARSWRGITRSELEARFRSLLDQAGLPAPRINEGIALDELFIEADAVWPDAKLIVELDGYAYHRGATAFERDRARDRAAVAAGWRVIRVTWKQLATEPKQLIRDLRRALDPH